MEGEKLGCGGVQYRIENSVKHPGGLEDGEGLQNGGGVADSHGAACGE